MYRTGGFKATEPERGDYEENSVKEYPLIEATCPVCRGVTYLDISIMTVEKIQFFCYWCEIDRLKENRERKARGVPAREKILHLYPLTRAAYIREVARTGALR